MKLIDIPTFEAQWCPVQIETAPGSGESLTVAIIVRGRTGQTSVRQAIPPATIQTIFGQAGKGMQFLIGQTVLSLHRQIENQVEVSQLEMPFGNSNIGPVRDCLARDLNEVFDIAMRLSSAFSLSMFGVQFDEKTDHEARRAFAEWAEKVRLQVLTAEWQEALKFSFNIPLKVSSRKKVNLGFQYGSYVAQFGVLRPGRSVSADVRALKLKLFDFDTLRREQLLPIRKAEILVGYQSPADTYPARQVETLAESWHYIESEAKARDVRAVRCINAVEAANHLYEMAKAA